MPEQPFERFVRGMAYYIDIYIYVCMYNISLCIYIYVVIYSKNK